MIEKGPRWLEILAANLYPAIENYELDADDNDNLFIYIPFRI